MALDQKKEAFQKALVSLFKALDQEQDEFVRDSIIQRFEYSAELFWKFLKDYLAEKQNIEVLSPNNVMRESRNAGFLDEKEVEFGIKMIKDRNLSSHAYNEALAIAIVAKVRTYADFMDKIRKRLDAQ